MTTRRVRRGEVVDFVRANIEAMRKARLDEEHARPVGQRVADAVGRFAGSTAFVVAHVVWFAAWVAFNVTSHAFDPWPFALLTVITSIEAIFLATFVLIAQNRMTEEADRRADLDLQTDLLAEHEITRLLEIVDAIATKLGVAIDRAELVELEQDVPPEQMLSQIKGPGGAAVPRRPRVKRAGFWRRTITASKRSR